MNYSGVVDNVLVANNTTIDAGNGIRLSGNATATTMTNVAITGNDFGYGDRGLTHRPSLWIQSQSQETISMITIRLVCAFQVHRQLSQTLR